MDILSVINPFSTCTEVYTNCSQRRYLLGVLSNSRRGRVLSEMFKQIKWLIWCDVEVMAWLQQILLWLPCTRRYSGKCRGISWYILKKKRYKITESELAILFTHRIKHASLSIAYLEIIRALAWHELELTI